MGCLMCRNQVVLSLCVGEAPDNMLSATAAGLVRTLDLVFLSPHENIEAATSRLSVRLSVAFDVRFLPDAIYDTCNTHYATDLGREVVCFFPQLTVT